MPSTLLVIDDCEIMLALVRARAKPEGYRILTTISWEEGLELAATERPDLILLDMEIGHQSGFDVYARLKADPRTRALPVIFLTGCEDQATRAHAFALGAVDYVIKPFEPADFRARLRSALVCRAVAAHALESS